MLISIQRLSKFGLHLSIASALALSVGACSNTNETDQTKKESQAQQASQNITEKKQASGSKQQADKLVPTPIDNELTNNESGSEPQAETSADFDEPEKQADKANSKNSHSLIEDMGFSKAETDAATVSIDEPEQEALQCNSKTEDPTIADISTEQACSRISARLASVEYEACQAAKLKSTSCNSVGGFPILMSEFAPLDEREPQGRILIIGGTHGDELTSVSVTLRWIEKLNRYHSGLFHWHMVPMMNPDGVLKAGATRTNRNGVDLNRNMPSDDWERNALKYWREKGGKNPRKYPGERPSSEPETRWLINEINDFKPDAIISVHAPYGVVDFDSLVLNTAPKNLGKLHLNLLGTYPGSLGNYAGINRNIPVITLELPHSWVMPSDAETTKIWEDIVSWLKQNVNASGDQQTASKP